MDGSDYGRMFDGIAINVVKKGGERHTEGLLLNKKPMIIMSIHWVHTILIMTVFPKSKMGQNVVRVI